MAGFSIIALMTFIIPVLLAFLALLIFLIIYGIVCYFLKSTFIYKVSKNKNYNYPITSWIPFYNNVNLGKIAGEEKYGWIIFVCDLLLIISMIISTYVTNVPTLIDKIITYVSTLSILAVLVLSIIVSNKIIKKAYPTISKILCIINIITLGFFKSVILFIIRKNKNLI